MNQPLLPDRILVGLTLPPAERRGRPAAQADRETLRTVVWLATHIKASVRLVHAIEEDSLGPLAAAGAAARAREAATARLEGHAQALADSGVDVDFGVIDGAPWSALLRESRSWDAGLIVCGSRGSTSLFGHALFGSTARRLARHAERPVWIVHPSAADPPVSHIGVAVDFSDVSQTLVGYGHRLRKAVGAQLHLLHSLPYRDAYHSVDPGTLRRDKAEKAHRDAMTATMERVEALLGDEQAGWHVHVGDGPVVRDVIELVDKEGIELLVLGSVSRTGVPGLVVGNTAEKVLERVGCSLLVLKPEGFESAARTDGDLNEGVAGERFIR